MNNKLIPIVITLVVGIILAGSVLMPVLNDAKKTIGDEVTYTNGTIGTYRLAETDEDLTITMTKGSGTWTIDINGDSFQTTNDGNLNLLYSDAIVITKNNSGDGLTINYNGVASTNSTTKEIIFSDGTVKFDEVVNDTHTTYYEGAYSWVYLPDTTGIYVNHTGTEAFYVKSIDDVIMGGAYISGENDCQYSFHDGELKTTWEGETSITYDMELVDGTTDIYKVSNVLIHIGDESFTPYRYLTPASVTGHEASGASYSLLGAIPVMVIVALIMGAVAMIVVKRND